MLLNGPGAEMTSGKRPGLPLDDTDTDGKDFRQRELKLEVFRPHIC